MSDTRPSLARKVTTSSEKRRAADLDEGVQLTIAGQTHRVTVGDLTPALARQLRRETGGSFQALIGELATDPDIDSIAALVWLARRVAGEVVELDDVTISYADMLGDDFDIEQAGADRGQDGSPEA